MEFEDIMALDTSEPTADESAEIKGFLDTASARERQDISERHPCEFAEWCDEKEKGYRDFREV
jgi:hypothetical protein